MSSERLLVIADLLELWQWTGDEAFLKEMWPAAKAAAEWQMDRANNPSSVHKHSAVALSLSLSLSLSLFQGRF